MSGRNAPSHASSLSHPFGNSGFETVGGTLRPDRVNLCVRISLDAIPAIAEIRTRSRTCSASATFHFSRMLHPLHLSTPTRLIGTFLLGVVVALAAPPAAVGSALAPQQLAAIDAFVTTEMARQQIPGVAVGIYRQGDVLLTKGYGLANLELNVPVKSETIFQSGSVGKQFTAAAILLLVDDGKVGLDDSITKYFPNAPATWKPILIKNLLSHTSGLAEYETGERTEPNGPFFQRLDFTEDELVAKFFALPIEWAPGESWAYCNTNYALLGILIHKVTGLHYADFLAARVFKPLGMVATRLISERDLVPNRAAGYELDEHGEIKNQGWVSPTFNSTADGTLYYNVVDLAKWAGALDGTHVLKPALLAQSWTVYPLNNGKPNPAGYGFGWLVRQQNHHRLVEHSGAWQGFTGYFSHYPDDGLSVAVLTNLDAGHANVGLLSHVIAGLAEPALLPAKLAPIPDTEPKLAETLSGLLDRLAAGEDLHAQGTPRFVDAFSPDTAAEARLRLAKFWPGGTLTLVKRIPAMTPTDRPSSTFRLQKGSASGIVTFRPNAEGKIVIFRLTPDRDYDQ